MIVLKALSIWMLFLVGAILNGVSRESLFTPLFGENVALPLSGVTLSAFIFLVTYWTVPLFGRNPGNVFISIGLLWLGITLAFEFTFASFTAERNWRDIIPMLNPFTGNLLLLVLLVTTVAPWTTAKLKKLIKITG